MPLNGYNKCIYYLVLLAKNVYERKPIDAENINICTSYFHVSRNGSHFFLKKIAEAS